MTKILNKTLITVITVMLLSEIAFAGVEIGNEVITDEGRPRSTAITLCETRMDWVRFVEYQESINPHFSKFFDLIKEVHPRTHYQLMQKTTKVVFCETTHPINESMLNFKSENKRVALWIEKGEINKDLLLIDKNIFYDNVISDQERAATIFRELLQPTYFKNSSRSPEQLEWIKHNIVNFAYKMYLNPTRENKINFLKLISDYSILIQTFDILHACNLYSFNTCKGYISLQNEVFGVNNKTADYISVFNGMMRIIAEKLNYNTNQHIDYLLSTGLKVDEVNFYPTPYNESIEVTSQKIFDPNGNKRRIIVKVFLNSRQHKESINPHFDFINLMYNVNIFSEKLKINNQTVNGQLDSLVANKFFKECYEEGLDACRTEYKHFSKLPIDINRVYTKTIKRHFAQGSDFDYANDNILNTMSPPSAEKIDHLIATDTHVIIKFEHNDEVYSLSSCTPSKAITCITNADHFRAKHPWLKDSKPFVYRISNFEPILSNLEALSIDEINKFVDISANLFITSRPNNPSPSAQALFNFLSKHNKFINLQTALMLKRAVDNGYYTKNVKYKNISLKGILKLFPETKKTIKKLKWGTVRL